MRYLSFILVLLCAGSCTLEKLHDSVEITEEIAAAPDAAFQVIGNECDTPCEVTFANNSENAVSYQWDFGDGSSISTDFEPSHTYTEHGGYSVKLTAFNSLGEADSITNPVTIIDPECPVLVGFEIINNNCNAPCIIEFGNTSQNANSFLWDFGDGNTSTEENPQHQYSQVGDFPVTLTASNGDCENPASDIVTIGCGVEADFSFTTDTPCKAPCAIQITNNSTNATSYEWDFGDGTSSTMATPDKVFERPGDYSVKLIVSDGVCEQTKSLSISVGWWTFEKTFGGIEGDDGHYVLQSKDNGYVIFGATASLGSGSTDAYLVKTYPSGDSKWEKTFGGIDGDWGYSGYEKPDEGYLLLGMTRSIGEGNLDAYLINTNFNGDLELEMAFGGISDDRGYSIDRTTEGGYIIAGYTTSIGAGSSDMYLIKINSAGEKEWDKAIGTTAPDSGRFVRETNDSGFIIVGHTQNTGDANLYLVKTNSLGEIEWNQSFGGSSSEFGYGVEQTADGGYIIVGSTSSMGAGSFDVYTIKITSSGIMEWEKTFGGTESDEGQAIKQTADGGYIIIGSTSSMGAGNADVYMIKITSNGIMEWEKTFGGTEVDLGRSIAQTTDGGYIITGQSESFGAGYRDIYLIKTDSEGNVE